MPLCLIISSISWSQKSELDSLYNVLATSSDTNNIASAHARVCWLLINTNIKNAQAHIDSSRTLFTHLGDEWGIAIVEYKEGVINRKTGDFQDGLNNFDKYMAYAQSIGKTSMVYDGKFQQAVIYQQQGSLNQSLALYFELLDHYKSEKDIKGQGFILNSIGIIYKNLGELEEAKEKYRQSIALLDTTNFKNDLANSYANLSAVFVLENDLEDAKLYLEKAMLINSELNNNWGMAISYDEMGSIHMLNGEFDKSENSFKKALAIQNEHNFKEKSLTLKNLGVLNLKTNNFLKSEAYLKSVLSMNLSILELKDIHKDLSELYKKTGDNETALIHFEKYVIYNDSVRGMENLKDINRLKFQFETAQKDKEIIQQDLIIKDQDIQLFKKEANFKTSLILAGAALLGLIFLFFHYRQRQHLKNKEIESLKVSRELTKLEALIEGEEKERKRLAQDLHDGINGDLSVIKYKVTALDKSKLDERETEEYNSSIIMLDNAIEQIRSISHDLAPPSLQNYNLTEAISEYCIKISSGSNLNMNFQNYGEAIELPVDVETAIYRVTQELLNNSVRHSQAKNVLVQINFHENALHISVQDDGIGYDRSVKKSGLGLKNIKSRAQFLGAELNVESSDKGTLTTVDVNFKSRT